MCFVFSPIGCVRVLELQTISALHLAKPFGHHPAPRSGFKGTPLAVAPGTDFVALPHPSGAPTGRSPPRRRAGSASVHHPHGAGALSCAVSRALGKVSLARGDQSNLLLTLQEAKIVSQWPNGSYGTETGLVCANYSVNYYSLSETCFGRRECVP